MTETMQHKWAITGQEEHPTIGDDGRPTTEHVTKFKTMHGHESSVTTADKNYSAENVHAQVEHKARELNKVREMHPDHKPTPPGEEQK